MSNLTVYKLPLHLIPLFRNSGLAGYASSYSAEIHEFATNLNWLDLKSANYSQLANKLKHFERVDQVVQPNQYQLRGDTISIWGIGYDLPCRCSFFGEEFESAYTYDPRYGRKHDQISGMQISSSIPTESFDRNSIHLYYNDSKQFHCYSNSEPQILARHRRSAKIVSTDYEFPQLFFGNSKLLQAELTRYENLGYKIGIITSNPTDLDSVASEYIVEVGHKFASYDRKLLSQLSAGWQSSQQQQLLLTDRELYGTIRLLEIAATDQERLQRQLGDQVQAGDLVVHEDYGIGKYHGLTFEEFADRREEYIELEFDKSDRVFVPMSQTDKLSKYISMSGSQPPSLSRLGRKQWQRVRRQAKQAIGVVAKELLAHYAQRELATAIPVDSNDSPEYLDFIAQFPYQFTADQHRATDEIINDLAKEQPMNRILVGDVGFGKTEVFTRAAFKVCESGGQVAILCPTTILATQHYEVLKHRFANTGARVEILSRFNSGKQNRDIVDALNSGSVDIVIGTHRLLSGDVKFKQLGLLVIDEEQKFGVKQKEKIKKLNYGTHLLSVTATPIPRTLSMALSSIRDISIIATAPPGRKSVITKLLKNDWNEIQSAITAEVERGGQVYFVHNSVQTIASVTTKLRKMLPHITFRHAHGQMPPSKLTKIMEDFYSNKFNVLIATTIIENGVDVPNANTMIIDRAHTFGLSQLYQLRGRIGRSAQQSYCYLFYSGRSKQQEKELMEAGHVEKKKIKPKAYLERLTTILNSSDLGSGFKIASKDLEIRGAGNLLGTQQSGQISTLGYNLYMKLLAQEIQKLKGQKQPLPIISF